jgi:hypothetical protein
MRSFIICIASPHMKEYDMGRICSTHGKDENAYDMLVGKPERKRPLGRPRHR